MSFGELAQIYLSQFKALVPGPYILLSRQPKWYNYFTKLFQLET